MEEIDDFDDTNMLSLFTEEEWKSLFPREFKSEELFDFLPEPLDSFNSMPSNNEFVHLLGNNLTDCEAEDSKPIFMHSVSPSIMFSSTIQMDRSSEPTNYANTNSNSNFHISDPDLCPNGDCANLDEVMNWKNYNKTTPDNSTRIQKKNSNSTSQALINQRKDLFNYFLTKDSANFSPEEYDNYYTLDFIRQINNHSFKNVSSTKTDDFFKTKLLEQKGELMKCWNENLENLPTLSIKSSKEKIPAFSFETSIDSGIDLESKNVDYLSYNENMLTKVVQKIKFVENNGEKLTGQSNENIKKKLRQRKSLTNKKRKLKPRAPLKNKKRKSPPPVDLDFIQEDSNESFENSKKNVQLIIDKKLKEKIENFEESKEQPKMIYLEARLAFKNHNYKEALDLCEWIAFPKNFHRAMQEIWDLSHEMIESKKRGRQLGSVQRFRLKQRFEYPETIWDGDRVKYGMSIKNKKILILFYDKFSKNPNAEEREKLAKIIDTEPAKVMTFFKNRRSRSGDTRTKSNEPKSKTIDWNRFIQLKNELLAE